MNLLQSTYELIDAATNEEAAEKGTKLTSAQIAAGAGVDPHWFDKFRQKRIASPGVDKVQAVHDYLQSQVGHLSPPRSDGSECART